jgi:D-arabinan exo alpha-(1,3)/(1,5)-arabinofuranosidase (non-reducing end)
MWPEPHRIDPSVDSRAITFENPTGERGAGGSSFGGRKGSPQRRLEPDETVTLADIHGPGVIRHVWMTFPPAPPEVMRALWIEVFYNGANEPSISVPCLDFFGLPHGRPVPYASMLTSAQEGRGFNSYVPMPFEGHVRIELTNSAGRPMDLYYQLDHTLEPVDPSYLHVSFRRENPTTMKRDFVIDEGLRGPGRFFGCIVGIRVFDDGGMWYGEGELKIYRDGDDELPTICGTGLEDYVGSAWGLGAHHAPFAGTPLSVGAEGKLMPDWVGFYRWHVPDPVMFGDDLKVTIQQIGAAYLTPDTFDAFEAGHPVAGRGWFTRGTGAFGIHERIDDYCATSFVYCRVPQAVPRLDLGAALADIGRKDYEEPLPMERFLSV